MFNPKARIEFMAYYPALNVHITTINFHTKEEKKNPWCSNTGPKLYRGIPSGGWNLIKTGRALRAA